MRSGPIPLLGDVRGLCFSNQCSVPLKKETVGGLFSYALNCLMQFFRTSVRASLSRFESPVICLSAVSYVKENEQARVAF